MKVFYMILVLMCQLIIPTLVVLSLGTKKLINVKYVCLGLAQYFISKLCFTFIFGPIKRLNLNGYEIIFIQVILLTIFAVYVKIITYKKLFHVDTIEKAISIGCGEGIVEIYFLTLPQIINKLYYFIKINNGTIYSELSTIYTNSQIEEIINQFSQLSEPYFLFIGTSCLIILLLQIVLSYLIYTQESFLPNKIIMICLLVSFVSYSNYYIISLYSYLIAWMLTIVLIGCYIYFYKNRIIKSHIL